MKKSVFILIFILFSCSAFANNPFFWADEGRKGYSLSAFYDDGDGFSKNINHPFELNIVSDGILAGSGLALSGTAFLLENVFDVKNPKWDGNLLQKDDVNALDRLFMKPYSDNLHKLATVFTAAELVSPIILSSVTFKEWSENRSLKESMTFSLMYAEAFLLAYGIKDLTKVFVDRARPYMYFDGYPEDKVKDGDFFKSFPSGHTTNAFLGAGFTSYVFCKYFPDSNWRYAVVGGTYALAISTGVLRMASGNHFMTDVLTGAVIGTVCGIGVPFIHSIKDKNKGNGFLAKNIVISPMGAGFYFTL
ncbi:MAG: phosphatase PAP2 family protein [Treponema sp.]|nr:phosphatase PAP2 family protein [Treponema sp.]